MQVAQFPGGHSNLTYSDSRRRRRTGAAAAAARPGAAEGARHGARVPLADGAASGLPAGATSATRSATTRGCRLGVLRDGAAPRPRRASRGTAACRSDGRRAISEALIDALADLHAVDISRSPLAKLGKPAGFVDRQIQGWTERWQRSRPRCPRWMRSRAGSPRTCLPTQRTGGGSRRLQTRQRAARPARPTLVAIFDWEMSALGDPLVDLGIFLAYWAPTPSRQRDALTTVTTGPAISRRSQPGALRPAIRTRSVGDPLLRDVRALQDRGRHPADLLPLRHRPDRGRPLRDLRRARGSNTRAACGQSGGRSRLISGKM